MRWIISLVFLFAMCAPKETTESVADSTNVTSDSTALLDSSAVAATPAESKPKLDQFNIDILYPLNDENFVLVTAAVVRVYNKAGTSNSTDRIDEVDGPFTAKMLDSFTDVEDCRLPWYKIEYIDSHGATKKGWVGDYGTEVYQVDASAVTDTVYNIPELGAMKPGVMNGLPVIYSAGDGVDCSMNSKLVFFYDDKQLHLIDPHFTQETGEGDDVPANATYGYTHLETTHDPITIEQDEQGIRLVWIQSPRTWMRVEWKDNKLNSGDVVDEEAVAREAAVKKTSEASWKFLDFPMTY